MLGYTWTLKNVRTYVIPYDYIIMENNVENRIKFTKYAHKYACSLFRECDQNFCTVPYTTRVKYKSRLVSTYNTVVHLKSRRLLFSRERNLQFSQRTVPVLVWYGTVNDKLILYYVYSTSNFYLRYSLVRYRTTGTIIHLLLQNRITYIWYSTLL